MMMRLRATRPLRYQTRQLVAGEEFDASTRDARVLLAMRKATQIRPPAVVPPPSPAVREKIAAAVKPAILPRPPAPPPARAAGVTGNVASGEGGAPVGAMTSRAFSGNDRSPPKPRKDDSDDADS